MKKAWQNMSFRIDALSLRERTLAFAAATALLVFLFYTLVLNPLYAKQAAILARIDQQNNQLSGIDVEITRKLQAYAIDPDAANRQKLQKIRLDMAQMSATLRTMQKGLVAPDRIVFLLGNILQRHGKLQLISLSTLPAAATSDGSLTAPAGSQTARAGRDRPAAQAPGAFAGAVAAAGAALPGAAPARAPELLFRHDVQIVVQGNYADMLAYMTALEAMPGQLFWGRARLNVDAYPVASLTLTVYTLSLDEKWIKL